MATIKDIARVAGVSQGTVSNVLNGKDNVSSDKIQRVMKVVEEMGYAINEKAQNLRKGTAKVLAVVIPNIYDKMYIDFFTSFKYYAECNEYVVDLYTTNDDPDYEREQIQRIRSRMTEGVATFTSIADESRPYFEVGFSEDDVVFISHKQSYNSKFIGYDSKKAGKEIAKKILRGGYKNIALLTGPLTYSSKKIFHDTFMKEIEDVDKIFEIYSRVTTKQSRYQSAVRIFTHMSPDAIVTDSISLAQVVNDIYKNFYSDIKMDIFSLSPSYTVPETNIIKYEIDYRKMGTEAASYLINRNWNGNNEMLIQSKGFSDWSRIKAKSKDKVLNILSIGSPTTSALKTVVNLYEYNFGIKIRITELHSEGMYELIKNWSPELSYDVIRMDRDWFSSFAKQVFEPLTNVDNRITHDLIGYLPNVVKNYSYLNDVIYALPGTPSIQLLFYRKDLFENSRVKRMYYEMYKQALEVPKTFDEYNRIAYFFTKEFNKESPVEYGCTFTSGESSLVGVEYLTRYFSHSKELFDDQGNILFDIETAEKALKETEEAWNCSSKAKHMWWTDTAQEFMKGNAAMCIHMINHISEFVSSDSNIRGKIGWSAIPGNNPMLGGSVLGISKYSNNKEEALRFLKWINSDDISIAITLLGGMSAKNAAYDDSEVNDSYPWLDYAKKCFEKSQANYYHIVDEKIIELKELQNLLGVAVREGIMGNLDMDNVIKFAKSSYERIKKEKSSILVTDCRQRAPDNQSC